MIRFVVEAPQLKRLAAGGVNDLFRDGPLVRRWGMRLRSFWQERFAMLSRGGGEWPALKRATIARKTAIGSRTASSILRRYGPLFHSLDAVYSGLPGQYQVPVQGGLEVGVGGPGAYPGGLTIGQVARWHHDGAGRLPKRTIIVPPDSRVVDEMSNDLRQAINERLSNGG